MRRHYAGEILSPSTLKLGRPCSDPSFDSNALELLLLSSTLFHSIDQSTMAEDKKHVAPVIETVPNHEKIQYTTESGRPDYSADFVTPNEDNDLRRGLSQRHISLIAIAGAIGTGLFLGLGFSLQRAGPLGALLAYATVGSIICAVQFALGEVAALLPVTGSFVRHAEFLVDPAMGFAIGWNIVYGNWVGIPTEISAICVLFQYWSDINVSVCIVVSIVLSFCIGIAFVRVYGEVMYALATKKKYLF